MRQTTNYGLKITEGNDDWRNIFDDNADNMDAIDAAIAPMTGATDSTDGTSGVVPEPETGDQNKFLKGDASWAIPGVMTVNGRSPDASGNITVIEGGGSSSYGSYRLDANIPVSAWTGSGPYVATVSNQYITANMDGTETWLDDETAMLGDTTFTTSDGLLTISTIVKPTAAWGLHIALAVNGADVLADISNIREDVDYNTEAITGLSTNKAYQISIANADAIAAVYNKLNALTNGTTATIYIGGTAMSNLTNGAYSAAATGTVGKVTSSNYRFNLVVGNNTPVQIDQSGMSSSSWGTSTAHDISSTLGHGTAITASSLSALKTNLLSVANKADVNGFIAVKITPSFTSDGFTSGSNYGGHIYNIYKSNGSTTYFSAIVSNNLGEDVLIGYSNGTWYFNSLKKNVDVKVNTSDIVNTLTDTSTNKPLSAAQGKALNDKYTTLNSNTAVKALSSSEGIKTIALNSTICPENSVRWFNTRTSLVSELPASGEYGIARVTKRLAGSCFIEMFTDAGKIWRTSYNGSTWTAWDELALNSNFIRVVVQGKIADSSSGNFEGLGCATVLLFPSHKAVITYSYKLVGESAESSNFSYGLNSQLLRELDTSLPNITPFAGGKWRCYKNDGTLLFSQLGYGTRHEINGTRWTLGRLYNTSGSIGPWSANEFKTGYYIEGICLATY